MLVRVMFHIGNMSPNTAYLSCGNENSLENLQYNWAFSNEDEKILELFNMVKCLLMKVTSESHVSHFGTMNRNTSCYLGCVNENALETFKIRLRLGFSNEDEKILELFNMVKCLLMKVIGESHVSHLGL